MVKKGKAKKGHKKQNHGGLKHQIKKEKRPDKGGVRPTSGGLASAQKRLEEVKGIPQVGGTEKVKSPITREHFDSNGNSQRQTRSNKIAADVDPEQHQPESGPNASPYQSKKSSPGTNHREHQSKAEILKKSTNDGGTLEQSHSKSGFKGAPKRKSAADVAPPDQREIKTRYEAVMPQSKKNGDGATPVEESLSKFEPRASKRKSTTDAPSEQPKSDAGYKASISKGKKPPAPAPGQHESKAASKGLPVPRTLRVVAMPKAKKSGASDTAKKRESGPELKHVEMENLSDADDAPVEQESHAAIFKKKSTSNAAPAEQGKSKTSVLKGKKTTVDTTPKRDSKAVMHSTKKSASDSAPKQDSKAVTRNSKKSTVHATPEQESGAVVPHSKGIASDDTPKQESRAVTRNSKKITGDAPPELGTKSVTPTSKKGTVDTVSPHHQKPKTVMLKGTDTTADAVSSEQYESRARTSKRKKTSTDASPERYDLKEAKRKKSESDASPKRHESVSVGKLGVSKGKTISAAAIPERAESKAGGKLSVPSGKKGNTSDNAEQVELKTGSKFSPRRGKNTVESKPAVAKSKNGATAGTPEQIEAETGGKLTMSKSKKSPKQVEFKTVGKPVTRRSMRISIDAIPEQVESKPTSDSKKGATDATSPEQVELRTRAKLRMPNNKESTADITTGQMKSKIGGKPAMQKGKKSAIDTPTRPGQAQLRTGNKAGLFNRKKNNASITTEEHHSKAATKRKSVAGSGPSEQQNSQTGSKAVVSKSKKSTSPTSLPRQVELKTGFKSKQSKGRKGTPGVSLRGKVQSGSRITPPRAVDGASPQKRKKIEQELKRSSDGGKESNPSSPTNGEPGGKLGSVLESGNARKRKFGKDYGDLPAAKNARLQNETPASQAGGLGLKTRSSLQNDPTVRLEEALPLLGRRGNKSVRGQSSPVGSELAEEVTSRVQLESPTDAEGGVSALCFEHPDVTNSSELSKEKPTPLCTEMGQEEIALPDESVEEGLFLHEVREGTAPDELAGKRPASDTSEGVALVPGLIEKQEAPVCSVSQGEMLSDGSVLTANLPSVEVNVEEAILPSGLPEKANNPDFEVRVEEAVLPSGSIEVVDYPSGEVHVEDAILSSESEEKVGHPGGELHVQVAVLSSGSTEKANSSSGGVRMEEAAFLSGLAEREKRPSGELIEDEMARSNELAEKMSRPLGEMGTREVMLRSGSLEEASHPGGEVSEKEMAKSYGTERGSCPIGRLSEGDILLPHGSVGNEGEPSDKVSKGEMMEPGGLEKASGPSGEVGKENVMLPCELLEKANRPGGEVTGGDIILPDEQLQGVHCPSGESSREEMTPSLVFVKEANHLSGEVNRDEIGVPDELLEKAKHPGSEMGEEIILPGELLEEASLPSDKVGKEGLTMPDGLPEEVNQCSFEESKNVIVLSSESVEREKQSGGDVSKEQLLPSGLVVKVDHPVSHVGEKQVAVRDDLLDKINHSSCEVGEEKVSSSDGLVEEKHLPVGDTNEEIIFSDKSVDTCKLLEVEPDLPDKLVENLHGMIEDETAFSRELIDKKSLDISELPKEEIILSNGMVERSSLPHDVLSSHEMTFPIQLIENTNPCNDKLGKQEIVLAPGLVENTVFGASEFRKEEIVLPTGSVITHTPVGDFSKEMALLDGSVGDTSLAGSKLTTLPDCSVETIDLAGGKLNGEGTGELVNVNFLSSTAVEEVALPDESAEENYVGKVSVGEFALSTELVERMDLLDDKVVRRDVGLTSGLVENLSGSEVLEEKTGFPSNEVAVEKANLLRSPAAEEKMGPVSKGDAGLPSNKMVEWGVSLQSSKAIDEGIMSAKDLICVTDPLTAEANREGSKEGIMLCQGLMDVASLPMARANEGVIGGVIGLSEELALTGNLAITGVNGEGTEGLVSGPSLPSAEMNEDVDDEEIALPEQLVHTTNLMITEVKEASEGTLVRKESVRLSNLPVIRGNEVSKEQASSSEELVGTTDLPVGVDREMSEEAITLSSELVSPIKPLASEVDEGMMREKMPSSEGVVDGVMTGDETAMTGGETAISGGLLGTGGLPISEVSEKVSEVYTALPQGLVNAVTLPCTELNTMVCEEVVTSSEGLVGAANFNITQVSAEEVMSSKDATSLPATEINLVREEVTSSGDSINALVIEVNEVVSGEGTTLSKDPVGVPISEVDEDVNEEEAKLSMLVDGSVTKEASEGETTSLKGVVATTNLATTEMDLGSLPSELVDGKNVGSSATGKDVTFPDKLVLNRSLLSGKGSEEETPVLHELVQTNDLSSGVLSKVTSDGTPETNKLTCSLMIGHEMRLVEQVGLPICEEGTTLTDGSVDKTGLHGCQGEPTETTLFNGLVEKVSLTVSRREATFSVAQVNMGVSYSGITAGVAPSLPLGSLMENVDLLSREGETTAFNESVEKVSPLGLEKETALPNEHETHGPSNSGISVQGILLPVELRLRELCLPGSEKETVTPSGQETVRLPRSGEETSPPDRQVCIDPPRSASPNGQVNATLPGSQEETMSPNAQAYGALPGSEEETASPSGQVDIGLPGSEEITLPSGQVNMNLSLPSSRVGNEETSVHIGLLDDLSLPNSEMSEEGNSLPVGWVDSLSLSVSEMSEDESTLPCAIIEKNSLPVIKVSEQEVAFAFSLVENIEPESELSEQEVVTSAGLVEMGPPTGEVNEERTMFHVQDKVDWPGIDVNERSESFANTEVVKDVTAHAVGLVEKADDPNLKGGDLTLHSELVEKINPSGSKITVSGTLTTELVEKIDHPESRMGDTLTGDPVERIDRPSSRESDMLPEDLVGRIDHPSSSASQEEMTLPGASTSLGADRSGDFFFLTKNRT